MSNLQSAETGPDEATVLSDDQLDAASGGMEIPPPELKQVLKESQ